MGILNYHKQGTGREKIIKKFILFRSLVLVFHTVIMFSQTAQPYYYPQMNAASYCVLVFGSAALLNGILLLVYPIKKHKTSCQMPHGALHVKNCWAPGIITACFSAVNYLSMLGSTRISAAIQFPIQNAGGLIVSTLASFVFFGAPMSVKKGNRYIFGIKT